jgi:dTDP-4-amino-4,6-dideoxygalactose transaminase
MVRIPQAAPGLKLESRRREIDEVLGRVLASGRYILGAETEAFEAEFGRYIGLPHVIGVNSGTDALTLALDACEIGSGDEVLVPAMTAPATAIAVQRVGAHPCFVDVEMKTRGMNPELIEAAICPRTKAIIVVHLHGIPAQIARIVDIARARSLLVIEDCAQAHGARVDGVHVGNFGDVAAFSFYPTKNLGCFGDGGCVATKSEALSARMRQRCNYGLDTNKVCTDSGFNSRLDEMQAAMLRVFLPTLDADNHERKALAHLYDQTLGPLSKEGLIGLPPAPPGAVYHQYAITSPHRDRLRHTLCKAGVGTDIHYPLALHRHPVFNYESDRPKDDVAPNADLLASSLLSLPIQAQFMRHQVEIMAALRAALCEMTERGKIS